MTEITEMIVGSEKLTSIFGGWPSFHDAEVLEIHFWRGHIARLLTPQKYFLS
jgi:hypothetical protein